MEETIASIFLGLGLAASVGFRVFMPLLVLSVASHFGQIPLNESWAWVGSIPAMSALGVATVLEIAAFYIPWVDNLLDTVAVPTATLAGTAAMASTTMDLDPLWQWSLAIIAGGGTAGLIKGAGAQTRVASTASTGGLANPLLATAETLSAGALSLLSVFIWPIAAVIAILLIVGAIFFMKKMLKFWRKLWGVT
ncbi:MAG: DUF4126 domain-containing protein [Saprospiraceae bacterium]|nr:DUF4126 domain-containing protein [Saprospiraceae bacterium]